MKGIVTVFKGELEGKDQLRERLINMSIEVKEVGDAYVFNPKSGSLVEFLQILKANKIAYGTDFDTLQESSERFRERQSGL